MRKLILILCALCLCTTVSSAGITDKLKSVIARKNATAACVTTNMNLFWTAEAFNFSGTNSDECDLGDVADGTDCGDTDEVVGDESGSAINADAAYYGSNGLDLPTADDYVAIVVPITIDDEGRFGFWLRMTDANDTGRLAMFSDDGNDYFILSLVGSGTPELRFTWMDDGNARTDCDTSSAGLSEGTWFYIEMAWKVADDYRDILINGVSKTSCSTTIGAMAGGGAQNLYVGDGTGTTIDFHMDNLILVTDSTQDLNGTCSTTEAYPNA